MASFNEIQSRNDLADFLGIPRSKLTYILYKNKEEKLYSSFTIPKKRGGERVINAPINDLKLIQRRIASALWLHQKSIWQDENVKPNISHGFVKGKSIITNAKIHRNKYFILNVDLENFFDSFHFGRVRGFFEKNKFFQLPKDVATTFAQLTCYNGCLPQGSPSSPIITNFICQILDYRLLGIAKEYKLDYTRYADDLTFSTNQRCFTEKIDEFLLKLSKEIEHAGFHINNTKTRLIYKNSKQEVTGLIVNEKLNVDSRYYKFTRAMAHSLYANSEFSIAGVKGNIRQLEGRFAFIDKLSKYNNSLDGNKHSAWVLSAREEEYRKFLFYKYFYQNTMPLVITEGKTDELYIKAALKNLYHRFPKLVEKNKQGLFEFNIQFLRRTKRLNYFFALVLHGADAMRNIISFYTSGGNFPNYAGHFNKICKSPPINPVILIFDNELNFKDRPISKIINGFEQKDAMKSSLRQNLYANYNSNLYIATYPLVEEKQSCCIEELFDAKTLAIKIEGKKFSLNDSFNNKEYVGKDKFSKYIYSNYKTINFSGFISFFEAISNLIDNYHK